MSINIEATKVAGVVREANQALEGKNFNMGEVIIGLSELLGRVIVQTGSTQIQMDEMKSVVIDHLTRTIRIGAHATEKSIIQRG